MNDVQRPIRINGRWHMYNLVNADHPRGNGTSWRHFVSDDLVRWSDEGIAIDKYRDGLGDIETGSIVIDHAGTAGFGPGAAIAIVTQQADGIQQQSLYGSTDEGAHFAPHPRNPIMPNPGEPDFRDPKVVRDPHSDSWIMALAEGHRIGFYTSADLLTWTYRSDFARDDLGTMECPDLYRIGLDGDPSKARWVLAVSANGTEYGRGPGVAYWVGEWDGQGFAADGGAHAAPQWLDDGPDYYAGVTWVDDSASEAERLVSRFAIGWMSNWAYARDVRLPVGGTGGPDSIVRTIGLVTAPHGPQLRVEPLPGLRTLETDLDRTRLAAVSERARLVDAPAPPYRLRVRLGWGDARRAGIHLPGGVDVVADRETRTLAVRRDRDPSADRMPPVYRSPAFMRLPSGSGVDLDIVADESTVEIFCGGRSLSLLSTPRAGQVVVDALGSRTGTVVAECAALR